MPTGYLSIVLHAHLPFLRHPEDKTVMEERWLYEAVADTYLPLLRMFEGLAHDRAKMINQYRAIWFDYHVESLRLAAAAAAAKGEAGGK